MDSAPQFKEKFVAYVDILGFKNMVDGAEAGSGRTLLELLQILKVLSGKENHEQIKRNGPTSCPAAAYNEKDLDFQVTQVTDCVVVSSEISPAGVINLIYHCWSVVLGLLSHGVMCRGYIIKGKGFHTNEYLIGTGYQAAYAKESQVSVFKKVADERGTPFVEVDPGVCNYIQQCQDKCVSEQFERFVKSDGDVRAIFPFKRLSHGFIVDANFDSEKEKKSNDNMRKTVIRMKQEILKLMVSGKPEDIRKAEHYISALDAQLLECDRTDAMIDRLVLSGAENR